MIINCERCSTLYDLDEALLAPEGSPVQCTRCQAVFVARPPGAAAPAPLEATPAPAPEQPAGPPGAAGRSTETPRPARSGPNIYRRPQPPPLAAPPSRGRARPRSGAPPQDAVSAVDARLRRLARLKLAVIPLLVIVLLLLAWAGWAAWRRRPDPETERQRAEARALIAQDDASSLARALELLDGIQQGDHASPGAQGERGLARALLATAQADEVEPLESRLAAAAAEKARLEREQPPGFEDAQRALAMEVTRLQVELAPRRQKLEAQRARAADELRTLAAQHQGSLEAARGQAVLAVFDGSSEEVERLAGRLRATGPDDWADLVELWVAVRRDPAARDQAVPRLAALASAHPELIRARFVLARALQAAGRREEAISAVGRLLAANPRHERAQRLRAQLAVPPPVQAVPELPPPPPRPALVPRVAPRPPAAEVVTPPSAPPPQAAVNAQVEPAPKPAVEEPPAPAPLPPPPRPRAPEPALPLEPSGG